MRYRIRSSFSYGSMWMSLAPCWMADISITFTSLTTGASSPCRVSASTEISSISSRTSTSASATVAMSFNMSVAVASVSPPPDCPVVTEGALPE